MVPFRYQSFLKIRWWQYHFLLDLSQCRESEYKTMSSYKRKYTYDQNSNVQCDSSTDRGYSMDDWSGPSWYRVVGGAGTKLSTHAFTKVNNGECNTHYGGWVSGGDHPTPYTTVTRRVRFNRPGFTYTSRNHDISITNCNGFFVYYLPGTTTCRLRYCTQW